MADCFTDLYQALKGILPEKDIKQFSQNMLERANARALQRNVGWQDTISESTEEELRNLQRAMLVHQNTMIQMAKLMPRANKQIMNARDPTAIPLDETGARFIKSAAPGAQQSAAVLADTYSKTFPGMLGALIEKDKLGKFWNDRAYEEELMCSIHDGESSQNPNINKLAGHIKDTFEAQRQLLNREGVPVDKRFGYFGKNVHDRVNISSATGNILSDMKMRAQLWSKNIRGMDLHDEMMNRAFERWHNTTRPLLNESKTFQDSPDPKVAMRKIFNNIVSGSHISEEPASLEHVMKQPLVNLAKTMSESRELIFKDGSSFYKYNNTYGAGSLKGLVLNTLKDTGTRIGMIKKFSPNPEAYFNWLMNRATQEAQAKGISVNKLKRARSLFDTLMGKHNIPESPSLARIASNLITWTGLPKVGSLVFQALPDLAATMHVMNQNGVGYLTGTANILKNFANDILRTKSASERKQLANLLNVYAKSSFGNIARFASQDQGLGKFTSQAAHLMYTLDGMHYLDYLNRSTMGEMLSKFIAQNKDTEFDKLGVLAKSMQIYGIEKPDWDLARANVQKPFGNEHYFTPDTMQGIDHDQIEKYAGSKLSEPEAQEIRDQQEAKWRSYFSDQANTAQIQPDAVDKSFLLGNSVAGTAHGTIARLIAQFKMWPLAYTRRILTPLLNGNLASGSSMASRLPALSKFLLASTTLGYIGNSAKNLTEDKTPEDPSDVKTWINALVPSMGLYSNFFEGRLNSVDSTLGTISPTLEYGYDTAHAVAKVATDEYQRNILDEVNQRNNPGKALLDYAKYNTPFTNLWFLKYALNYSLMYGAYEQVAPGDLEHQQRELEKNGQSFIFNPATTRAF